MILLGACLLIAVLNGAIAFGFTRPASSRVRSALSMLNFDAVLFDCDGVIAETERDAHRVTFNQAFRSKGISMVSMAITLG